MRTALLIGLTACTTGMADEIHTTFINDGWAYSGNWDLVGQTMVVPESSSVLENFTFMAKVAGGDATYIIAVYEWDEVGQHITGESYFSDFGTLSDDDIVEIRSHQIGAHLPEGEKVAVVLGFFPEPGADHGVGYTFQDEYDGGSLVATNVSAIEPWIVDENEDYDMVFSATWGSCTADVDGNGELNIFDFLAFQALFTAGSIDADCNQDGVLNIVDFVCFQAEFQAGCGAD